jgi:hypothetical protein
MSIDLIDEFGIVASHPPREQQPLRVAPVVDKLFNTFEQDLTPLACMSLNDILFAFDSSFVAPEINRLLRLLPALRDKHKTPQAKLPLVSIFGHADPVGPLEYNKQLSGRRAKAVYALLTHRVDLWEELFHSPFGGDDWGHIHAKGIMKKHVGTDQELPLHQLIDAYMKTLCPFQLEKTDFLGKGADAGFRADFQGCSKFNPLLIFSREETKDLEQPDHHQRRNAENQPNRRVVIYLFCPNIKLNARLWPCPRAKDDTSACKQRLFADSQKRLAPGEKRREFPKARQTFGCRFYARIAQASPCDRILDSYRIRLFNQRAEPLPFAPWALFDGKRTLSGRADADAFLRIMDLSTPAQCRVRWNTPKPGDDASSPDADPDGAFDFEMDVFVDIPAAGEDAARQRLHNLGYTAQADEAENVREFQNDYKDRFADLQPNGILDPATQKALADVQDECDPSVKKDEETDKG